MQSRTLSATSPLVASPALPRSEQSVLLDDLPQLPRPRSLRSFYLAMGLLTLAYALLLNPYWVPGGDSEVYTAMARSIARGDGFESGMLLRFNGQAAAISPPGWPLALAGLLLISPTFLFLKVVTTLCFLGSHAAMFFCLRRFCSDRTAAWTVALAGILYPVAQLTMLLHSEALFCLLASVCLLLAMRIGEGRGRWLETIALLLLASAAAVVRWQGIIQLPLLIAALLQGSLRPRWRVLPQDASTITRLAGGVGGAMSKLLNVRGLALVLVSVVTIGTFFITHEKLTLTKQQKQLASDAGGTADAETPDSSAQPPKTGPNEAEAPPILTRSSNSDRGLASEYVHRFTNAGRWFTWTLWYPNRFVDGRPIFFAISLAIGWLVIVLLMCAMLEGIRRRQWLWIGLAIYTGALCMNWPDPNARYFVPIAPWLVLGVFVGLNYIRSLHAARQLAIATRVAGVIFAVTLLASNLTLYAGEMERMRSGTRFYERFEAGANAELIDACEFIRFHSQSMERVAISEKYVNLGRTRYNKTGLRAAHLLTDRIIYAVPRSGVMAARPGLPSSKLSKHLRGPTIVPGGVEFYLFQSPWLPWRLWHFRLPPTLQAKLSGGSPSDYAEPVGGWELYRREPGMTAYKRFDPPGERHLPTRVPGM